MNLKRNERKSDESTHEQFKVEWYQISKELKERESEIHILKNLICKVNEDREKKKEALEQCEKLLEVVRKTKDDDKTVIEELKRKNSELECVIEVVKKTKEDGKKILEELNCKNAELDCAIEVVKKTEEGDKKIIDGLTRKNLELEHAKRVVEHDFELCKRKYDELGRQISQLEDSYTMLKNQEPVAPNRINPNPGACSADSRELVGKKGPVNDKIQENRTGTGRCIFEIIRDDDRASVENLSRAHGNQKRRQDSYLDGCDGYYSERNDEDITILPSESNDKGSVGQTLATAQNCHSAKHVSGKNFSSGTNDSKKVMNSSRSAAVMFRQCAKKVGAECKSCSKLKYAASYRSDNSSEDCVRPPVIKKYERRGRIVKRTT